MMINWGRRGWAAAVSTGVVLSGIAGSACAFDMLRAKVYGYQGLDAGETEFAYTLGYLVDPGDTDKSEKTMTYFDKSDVDRKGLKSHTAEVEYGITDRWGISLYGDFQQPKGEDFRYIRTRAVMTRYRFFNKGERFFDTAVYFEYYVPRLQYQGGQDEKIEARFILEKELGSWDLRINPILEKPLSNTQSEGLVLEYSAGVYHGVSPKFELGLEAHGEFGQFSDFNSFDDQAHYLAPFVEFKIKDGIAVNAVYAWGVTDSSDKEVAKATLEIEL